LKYAIFEQGNIVYQGRIDVKYQSVKLHPFGSCMQGRSFSSAAYRYGFNGKEKETDGTADNYDFGARIYDGRLGRWLGVDPLFKKYKSYSTYVFAMNVPLFFIDMDGCELAPGIGEITKITPAIDLCRKSTTFCNYINKFVDICAFKVWLVFSCSSKKAQQRYSAQAKPTGNVQTRRCH
jgi:RHS repeat-associated protein